MTPKEKLMKKLPMKYQERVYDFTSEDDLIDNCKYILALNPGWHFCAMESFPVRSISEAIEFIKEAVWAGGDR